MECTVKWMSACARIDLARTTLLAWIYSWIISVCKYTLYTKEQFFLHSEKKYNNYKGDNYFTYRINVSLRLA